MAAPAGYRKYDSDAAKLKVYEHRMLVADKDFERWAPKVKKHIERYELERAQVEDLTPSGHRVNVPHGVSVIDALFSALTAVEVDVTVANLGGATREDAQLATAALQHEWRIADVPAKSEDAVKDALLAGYGWVKVGYEYAEETVRQQRALEDVRADLVRLIDENPGASPDDIAGMVDLEEDVTVPVVDRIVVDFVPWDSIRVDPSAKRLEDVRWVAQVDKVPVEEVRANPTYREYVKRTKGNLQKLESLEADSTIPSELMLDEPDADDERVTVITMYDLETGTVCTYAKGQDFLLNEAANPFALNLDLPDRNPFVPLILRRSNRRVRGISDMQVIEPTLDELATYRSRLATYLERINPKILGPEDGLTEAGKEALKSKEYGAYVEYSREGDANSFKPMDPPVLPAELFGMPDRLLQDIYEATGANEILRGLFPDRRRTATETSEVVAASTARQAEKRNQLERFYKAIAKRVLQLMMMFYDHPRVARIAESQLPANVTWEFTGDDIVLDIDFEVHLTPKEAKTLQSRRDDALAYLNVVGELAVPGPNGDSVVNAPELVRWFSEEWGLPEDVIRRIIQFPEERVAQRQERVDQVAAEASAAQGLPPDILAQVANIGVVPPDLAAAGLTGGPFAAEGAEQVSESAGVRVP